MTLAGIALGLATVVATRLTIRTVDRAYRNLFEGVVGRPALEVTAKGKGGFAADAAAGLGRWQRTCTTFASGIISYCNPMPIYAR